MRGPAKRTFPWVAASACALAALLAGCLLDHTLIAPQNAYDPRLALKGDSLARFDTVELLLVDPEHPGVSIRLWKGPLASAEGLPPHLAGDGQTLVYVVHGYRSDRGQCFTERVSQEGEHVVLVDTCAAKPGPDPDPGPKPDPDPKPGPDTMPKPAPIPGFLRDSLDFKDLDSVINVTIDSITDGGASGFSLRPSEAWIKAEPDSFHATGNKDIPVSVDRGGLAVGEHHGFLVLRADGKAVDTAYISLDVPKPVAQVNGTLLDWRDSLPQSGFTVALDGAEPGLLSDAKGAFAFPGVDLGKHVLSISSTGRLGLIDTFTIAEKGPFGRTLILAPSADFKTVNAGWSHHAGQAAAAAGHGLLLSSDFDQAGSLLTFPLDNAGPSLQKFIPQKNDDGDPDFPEYFEPGEMTADSQAVYIAYPDASRLGRIGNWEGAAQASAVALSFQPGGLLLDGAHLMALGRLSDSTLVLGDFNAADLSLNRVDTLKGFHWDGILPAQRSPKLAFLGNAYYAVDGNSPNTKGHILRIGRESRKVEDSRELPDAAINGLAIYDGMIYVTSMSSSGKSIRVLDPALSETGAIAAGANTGRIAFATEGRLRGYGFVATNDDADNAVLVIHPLSKKPVGRLRLPGSLPGRSMSVDGRTGSVLVSDGDKLHMAQF